MGKQNKIIIIGGGAAGMMAALTASNKAQVILLERNPRVGKKILITGNGRCNYTNIYTNINNYHGANPQFALEALNNFTVNQTINFFEKLGITPKVENQGKVFPLSEQASSILDVLRYELEEKGVEVITDAFVKNIAPKKNKFQIFLEDERVLEGDKVILTTGGKAKPSTGSDGNGYELAKTLGHTIVEVFPGLVQLKLDGNFFNQIQGVKFFGTAEIIANKKSIAKDKGEILFANYGVSGPPILQISRQASYCLEKNQAVQLKICLIDKMTPQELMNYLEKRFKHMTNKTLEIALIGFINKRLIPVLLKEANLNPKDLAKKINKKELERLVNLLTDWRFSIKGTKSWPSAQITAGGISTNEINPHTLESKLVKGLYFAGEIIDIDGDCGGFNLQWAWSSGYVAGTSVTGE